MKNLMKQTLMTGFFCCLACVTSAVKDEGEGRFLDEVKRFMSIQFPEALLLKGPPESASEKEADRYIPGARAALMKKYPETDPGNIIRFIWPKESWSILRNEFTGVVYARYCFAYVLTPSDKEDEYWAVQINFMQKARLMGFFFRETYVDSLVRVDRLKK